MMISCLIRFSCGDSTRFRFMATPYKVSRPHSLDTPHSVGLLWARNQPEAQNPIWQNTKEKNFYAISGIRTHDSRKRAAGNPRLRQRSCLIRKINFNACVNESHVSSLLANSSRRYCSFWKLRCKMCISLRKWWCWTALQTLNKHN